MEQSHLLWSHENLVNLTLETHQGGCKARKTENSFVEVEVSEGSHWQGKVKQVLDELISRISVDFCECLDLHFAVCLLLWTAAHALCSAGLLDSYSSQFVDTRKDGSGW